MVTMVHKRVQVMKDLKVLKDLKDQRVLREFWAQRETIMDLMVKVQNVQNENAYNGGSIIALIEEELTVEHSGAAQKAK